MALPSTVACFPRTHPSLVFLTGASAAGPEGTHGEQSAGSQEASNKPDAELPQVGALFLCPEAVQQELSGFLLWEAISFPQAA